MKSILKSLFLVFLIVMHGLMLVNYLKTGGNVTQIFWGIPVFVFNPSQITTIIFVQFLAILYLFLDKALELKHREINWKDWFEILLIIVFTFSIFIQFLNWATEGIERL